MKKFLHYILTLVFTTVLMLVVTYIYMLNKNEAVLFFSAFLIAFLTSLTGFFIWRIKYKDAFESFLVVLTYIMFNTLFIYFGPVTLDRSLSSFIYFYSVENGSITRDIFNEEYFVPYVQRRFVEGAKIGYLKCDEETCYPTLKSKFTYYVLYPFGRMTGAMTNYDEFKTMMENRK